MAMKEVVLVYSLFVAVEVCSIVLGEFVVGSTLSNGEMDILVDQTGISNGCLRTSEDPSGGTNVRDGAGEVCIISYEDLSTKYLGIT